MAIERDVWGGLGENPVLRDAWLEFDARVVDARRFGYGQEGVGGRWELRPHYCYYIPAAWDAPKHRALLDEVFGPKDGQDPYRETAETIAAFKINGKFINTAWDLNKPGCATREAMDWFTQNFLYPKWFFDLGKRVLWELRNVQPAPGADVEAKMLWLTQVAWWSNMMMGATNLHGSLMSMALRQTATGIGYSSWAQNGAYMFPTTHVEAMPGYYLQSITEAIQAIAGQVEPTAVFDYGYLIRAIDHAKLSDGLGISFWRGEPWSVPFETRRFRWCPVSTTAEYGSKSAFALRFVGPRELQGRYYGSGNANDPEWVDDGTGRVAWDAGRCIDQHHRWQMTVPWVVGLQQYGKINQGSSWTPPTRLGKLALERTLKMATFFDTRGGGDTEFWASIQRWKKYENVPGMRRRGTWNRTGRPRYTPNLELCYRYYYPGIIELLNACDYSEFCANGFNLWWTYNVGALTERTAQWAPMPTTTPTYTSGEFAGEVRRGNNGDRIMPMVAPPGYCEEARTIYNDEKKQSKGLGVVVNIGQTILAVIQAVYGNYGQLVGAVRGWVSYAAREYPVPEDSWLGVVPMTPMVQRLSPIHQWKGPNQEPSSLVMSGPDPTAGGDLRVPGQNPYANGQKEPWFGYNPPLGVVLERMRQGVVGWADAGAAFKPASDWMNLMSERKGSVSKKYEEPPPPPVSSSFNEAQRAAMAPDLPEAPPSRQDTTAAAKLGTVVAVAAAGAAALWGGIVVYRRLEP